MVEVEHCISHRYPTRLRSPHCNSSIFILIKAFSELSCSVDADIVILQETIPIRIEMFPYRIKVIII